MGGLGVESYVSMPGGGTLLLTYADKKGEGVQKSENFADIICEGSLMLTNYSSGSTCFNEFSICSLTML